jgi:hypothetical protein
VAVALAGATVVSLSGCWTDMPQIDPPVLELELRTSPTYCTGLWHMPNRNFAGSLSWALYATLVETEDGSDLPDLSEARITVDGVPTAQASIDGDGVLVGVLPLMEFGSYPISGLGVSLPDGTEYSFPVSYDLEVGAEGADVSCEGDDADAETIQNGILLSPLVEF